MAAELWTYRETLVEPATDLDLKQHHQQAAYGGDAEKRQHQSAIRLLPCHDGIGDPSPADREGEPDGRLHHGEPQMDLRNVDDACRFLLCHGLLIGSPGLDH